MKYEPLNIDVTFGAYFISKEVYQRVLEKVGFTNVQLHRITWVLPEDKEKEEYYKDFLEVNNIFTFTATRP